MRRKDERYTKWLNDIRSRQPLLDDPEALTTAVMDRIARTERRKAPERRARKRNEKAARIRLCVGLWTSGIAAAVLLCLLLAETAPLPAGPSGKEASAGETRLRYAASLPVEEWRGMTLTERKDYLVNRRKRQTALREERDARLARFKEPLDVEPIK